MVSEIRSAGIFGIDGYEVLAECDISNGLPAFDIVGLPDTAVKESRDRVRAAIKNCGFEFPMRRITVNLAPADLKKIGPIYDLAIMMGILCASYQIEGIARDMAFIGELSLEGNLRPGVGMLSMAEGLFRAGVRTLFVPEDNAREAALVPGLTVYSIKHVREIVRYLRGEITLTAEEPYRAATRGDEGADFCDVMGQEGAKRALEIAAAGGHNILLIGPPGSGKSMLAKCIPSILPDMTHEEALEATRIYSVSGLIKKEEPILRARPFRAPHHTISAVGLSGGGSNPKPGEISLSHNGVLFLDEMPEFASDVIEVLRAPMEDGTVSISRVLGRVTYPSRFMLVGAMNPCKCGYYGDPSGRCICTERSVSRYMSKISGPIFDRMDMHVHVPAVKFEELSVRRPAEKSKDVRTRVNTARDIQNARYAGTGISANAHLPPSMMRAHCTPDDKGRELLRGIFDNLNLTARAYDRILKVARTIADLAGEQNIKASHIAEAVQYRSLDRTRAGEA